jgi:hypothetical protein
VLWLKSCPKCGGDLSEDRDQYGPYISCVQCGHYLTEAEEVLLRYASRPRTNSPAPQPIQSPRAAVGVGR